jgi:hypothetical protein
MVIHLIDLSANLKLSQGVASKCEKSRKKQKAAEAASKREV